jgi:hypothetical protein
VSQEIFLSCEAISACSKNSSIRCYRSTWCGLNLNPAVERARVCGCGARRQGARRPQDRPLQRRITKPARPAVVQSGAERAHPEGEAQKGRKGHLRQGLFGGIERSTAGFRLNVARAPASPGGGDCPFNTIPDPLRLLACSNQIFRKGGRAAAIAVGARLTIVRVLWRDVDSESGVAGESSARRTRARRA